MSQNINTAAISGNMTRDPELKEFASGAAIAEFGVAVNKSKKVGDEWVDEVSYFEVKVWGEYGKLCARKLKKGDLVFVQGELDQERWETEGGDNRSKVVIIGRQLNSEGFFRSKDEDNDVSAAPAAPASAPAAAAPAAAAPAAAALPTDDDIPF